MQLSQRLGLALRSSPTALAKVDFNIPLSSIFISTSDLTSDELRVYISAQLHIAQRLLVFDNGQGVFFSHRHSFDDASSNFYLSVLDAVRPLGIMNAVRTMGSQGQNTLKCRRLSIAKFTIFHVSLEAP